MQRINQFRKAFTAPSLTLATLLLLALASARASGSELDMSVQLFNPDTHRLAMVWRFQGEIGEDGSVIGTAMLITPGRQPIVGTSVGFVDVDGILTLEGPQPENTIVVYGGVLVVDLLSGYAEWDVFSPPPSNLTGQAHVIIR